VPNIKLTDITSLNRGHFTLREVMAKWQYSMASFRRGSAVDVGAPLPLTLLLSLDPALLLYTGKMGTDTLRGGSAAAAGTAASAGAGAETGAGAGTGGCASIVIFGIAPRTLGIEEAAVGTGGE
jgi:hypothetical protein